MGAGPPPSTIEGERSTPTVEGEKHDSTSQGEHVNSSKETMGDDNFNTFNGPSGASPTSDNQQLVDVSGIIQNDVVEVVSTAAEEHQLQRLHIWTKDHTPNQIIGTPNAGVQTRSAKESTDFYLHSAFLSIVEPKNIKEALEHPDWISAMQEELVEFKRNEVWKLIPKPKGRTIVGTRWVFCNKLDDLGAVIRNKARLVAQGYRQ